MEKSNNTQNQVANLFSNSQEGNLLWQYVQSLDGETAVQLSQPSPQAAQIIERNLGEILGGLPSTHFATTITTNKENLGRLLASAMMTGYFLHRAEQRLELEQSLANLQENEQD